MNKPNISIETVSDDIVKAANAVATVVAGGLRIGLKKPNVLRQYQIVETVGASARNEVYMGMVMPLLWVTQIDGDDQPPPSTKRELEALISRLGEDGISAVMGHVAEQADAAVSGGAIKN
ncbi:hypothetical protein RugamoR64_21230 [Duganella rhizosphaerae]|uniref:hypothetical protein n=1 Tax=Duganella rhizosphaerae TaxID=2885763 RepID=UPI0030E9D03E